jgi:hypothetical protein
VPHYSTKNHIAKLVVKYEDYDQADPKISTNSNTSSTDCRALRFTTAVSMTHYCFVSNPPLHHQQTTTTTTAHPDVMRDGYD